MTMRHPITSQVQVQSSTVPAGGKLTFHALDLEGEGPLEVYLDSQWTQPIAVFDRSDGPNETVDARVSVPHDLSPGLHIMSFRTAQSQFDLLLQVTASKATVTIPNTVAHPGAPLAFVVSGFGGTVGHIKLGDDGEPQAFPINPDGSGSGHIAIPPDTAAGEHHLRFLARDPAISVLAPFTVSDRTDE